MFRIEDVLQIKDGEDVRLLVRRHPITLVPGLLLAFLLIVGPFFLLFPLFSWGTFGMAMFFVLVVGGIVIAVRTFSMWDADVFIITTLRVVEVDQRGFFSRFVSEAPFPSITDVTWRRHGLSATLFRMGHLEIRTSGTTPAMMIAHVAHPERIHELMNDLRHATSPQRIDISPERRERLRRLTESMGELPEDALDRIEAVVKREAKEIAMGHFLKKEL